MRLPGRVVVPLKSMCSRMCERPAPSHLPSWTLPDMHQAWAETTGALWSSRMMMVRPFSRLVRVTPGGEAGIVSDSADMVKLQTSNFKLQGNSKDQTPNQALV